MSRIIIKIYVFNLWTVVSEYLAVLNFTFSVYVNKLQLYYLLSVLFRWLCSSVLPSSVYTIVSHSHLTADGQSVSTSWCRAHFGTSDQSLLL
jgi:hypothetical protein